LIKMAYAHLLILLLNCGSSVVCVVLGFRNTKKLF